MSEDRVTWFNTTTDQYIERRGRTDSNEERPEIWIRYENLG